MKKALLLALTLALPLSAQAEFRGAWIASVYNINFPSDSGLSESAQKAQAVRLLDAAKAAKLNAVLLQVRPESDALYASSIEPWSRYLTGTQGRSPGYDPLAFFIAEAKKRGIAVHAWLNPYRAAASAGKPRAANHISKKFPQYTYKVGSVLWMDPGAPAVQKQIVAVARDLVKRYDIAGLHLDDYFYPYPTDSGARYPFPDDKTYAAYRASGGKLDRADWRRDNVNTLVRSLSDAVHSTRSGVMFGVSPFGIYTKGSPADVKAGVDQFHDLYSDPVKWMREGWVDYLAPQLYWAEGGPQSFSSLLRWWRSPSVNPRGVPVWPGIAVDRLSSHGWPASQIGTQLSLEKTISPRSHGGFLLWNIGPVAKNTKGVTSVVRSR
jgi:uncharacterized lipoprotein YddW (UPF0748 family)